MAESLHDSLVRELNEKEAKANDLIAKAGRTAAETKAALDLIGEVKGLKARIDQEAELGEWTAGAADRKSWAQTPRRDMPVPAATSLGSKKAGETTLSFKDGQLEGIDEESGAGCMGQDAWDAIQHKDYARCFKAYLRKGEKGLSRMEAKDLEAGFDDQGGVFAPVEMLARLIGRKPAPTNVLANVERLTTGAQKVTMPRLQYGADNIYTTAFRPKKTGENPPADNTARVDSTNLTGQVTIGVNTHMLELPLSLDLLEDAGFPIQQWTGDKFLEAANLQKERHALLGIGTDEPDGMLNNAKTAFEANRPEVILSGADGALGGYDALWGVQCALDAQYETETTRWVMNKRSTYKSIGLIKDSQNRPLFSEGVTNDGLVNRRMRVLLGDPIAFSAFMPNVGASAFPLIYGDLTGYYHLDRIGFSIQVLREVDARKNRVVLLARFRYGGAVVEPWKLKILKSHAS